MKIVIDISEYNIEWIKNTFGVPEDIDVAIARAIVNGVPLSEIEPERKTGKWLEKEVFDNDVPIIDQWQSAKCSVCGKYHTTPYMYYFDDYAFCPRCGSYNGGKTNAE